MSPPATSTSQSKKAQSKLTSPASATTDRATLAASILANKKNYDVKHILSSLTFVKTKPTEEQISKNLALLNDIARPLSPTLPLSPPVSPKPLKRKSPDHDGDNATSGAALDPVKRAKTTAAGPASSSASGSVSGKTVGAVDTDKPQSSRIASNEDGDVAAADLPTTSGTKGPQSTRKTRPREVMTHDKIKAIRDAYSQKAKTLKRSYEARLKLGKSDKDNLYAWLEAADSVLLFAYSFWAVGMTGVKELTPWENLLNFLTPIRANWQRRLNSARPDTLEQATAKMILGVLDFVRYCALWHMHKLCNQRLQALKATASSPPAGSGSPPISFQLTPPNAGQRASVSGPSPANSVASNQPNRTGLPTPPQPQQAASTNSNGASGSASADANQPSSSSNGRSTSDSPETVVVPSDMLSLVDKITVLAPQMSEAYVTANGLVTFYDLARYFPATQAICAGNNASTGRPLRPGVNEDAFQVDVPQSLHGKGEWAWPIACGTDIPHVVGFGRSLIWEIGVHQIGGKGYRGVDGAWEWEDGTAFGPPKQ